MRKFFIAGKGKKLIDVDYSQIELRVLAALAHDEVMTKTFEEGRDIHTETAASVFGLPDTLKVSVFLQAGIEQICRARLSVICFMVSLFVFRIGFCAARRLKSRAGGRRALSLSAGRSA